MEKYSVISRLQTKFGDVESIKIFNRHRDYIGKQEAFILNTDILFTDKD